MHNHKYRQRSVVLIQYPSTVLHRHFFATSEVLVYLYSLAATSRISHSTFKTTAILPGRSTSLQLIDTLRIVLLCRLLDRLPGRMSPSTVG